MYIMFLTIQSFIINWLVISLQPLFRQFIFTPQANIFGKALILNQNPYFDGDLLSSLGFAAVL